MPQIFQLSDTSLASAVYGVNHDLPCAGSFRLACSFFPNPRASPKNPFHTVFYYLSSNHQG